MGMRCMRSVMEMDERRKGCQGGMAGGKEVVCTV